MSDTAHTTVTAKWLLSPTSTELGHKDDHTWVVANDYREPVQLFVPENVFVQECKDGFRIPENGGAITLQLRVDNLRKVGKMEYQIRPVSPRAAGGESCASLTGGLEIKK